MNYRMSLGLVFKNIIFYIAKIMILNKNVKWIIPDLRSAHKVVSIYDTVMQFWGAVV